MKLYATITSERASKGQGGNKFLDIEIMAEKLEGIPTRANIYRLRLSVDGNRLYALLHDYSTGIEQDLITFRPAPIEKGKKQKGDKPHKYIACTWCGKNPTKTATSEYCSETCRRKALGWD